MKLQINKPLNWYRYETAKVKILWKGKPQIGIFKSAIEALNEIKNLCHIESELKEYSIHTPNGILNYSNFLN